MQIGKYHELEVVKEVDFGVYLASDIGEILLPKRYVPENAEVGTKLHVFVYRDSEDRVIATTEVPAGEVGDFVALKVVDLSPHGAFMEWGLMKDLFVPRKEQPVTFEIGHKYVVRICLDHKTDRLIGSGKLNAFFEKDTSILEGGMKCDLLIYEKTTLGYKAVVNNKYSGLIYPNEIFQPIEIGEPLQGYVKYIREDGKIDLALQPPGKKAIDTNMDRVLKELENSEDHFLPFHDKSSPDAIAGKFEMSKKAFKKAIGGLYKQELIELRPDGILLK